MLESNLDRPEDRIELSESLRRAVTVLRPHRDSLWRLADDGYRIDWFCYVGSHAAEHAGSTKVENSLMVKKERTRSPSGAAT